MRAILLLCLALAGCHEHILEVGSDPDEDCVWIVSDDTPAVITVHDLERCLDIKFMVLVV